MEQFEINKKFDEELEMQIKGDLKHDHVYELGRPRAILRSTGIPDLPIQLNAKRLLDKATLFGHDFNLGEIKGLVDKLNNPIAIFAYGNPKQAQNIILELEQNNKHFLVGLSLNPEVQGKRLEINSIRNIFPKQDTEWVNWIGQGKALYLNKKEIQTLIEQLQTIPADVNYLNLDFVAKVVKNFENPKMEQEIKHEVRESKYDNGQLEWRQEYRGGLEDGLYEAWHENGQLACRFHCKNGEKDGLYETWNENGQLDSRAQYKNGNLEGLAEVWHPNGQPLSRTFFKEGKMEGIQEQFYRTGQLEWRQEYKDGKKDGVDETWYKNGQRKWRFYWKNGKEDGLYEDWHENGQLKTRTQYKEGKREGLLENWYENGQRNVRMNYKNNLLDGLAEAWYPNGQLMERGYYKENKEHGLSETWNENGKLRERAVYKEGVKVSQSKKKTAISKLKRGLGL